MADKDYVKSVDPSLYCRIGQDESFITRARGAFALMVLWSVWLSGSFSPFWMLYLLVKGKFVAFGVALLVILYPWVVKVKQRPWFIRFILQGAGWWRGGACLYIEDSVKKVDCSENVLLCQHPHGLFCFGFFLNGSAARVHAGDPKTYVPQAFQHLPAKSTGLVEPNLFKIPLIRHFLLVFGCADPATKKRMNQLFEAKVPMGLLPGGSEEIILSQHGHERIFIKNRKGFIKYSLQHGYTLLLGYTFGDADSYRTLTWGVKWRLNFFKKTRIPVFFAWGTWWNPLLPRCDVALETVIGNPIQLPKIPNPTQADIDKWHDHYIDKLVDLFERNKAKFGYPDRTLELF